MRQFWILLLALLLPVETAGAQSLKEALLRHQTTGTPTIDRLCDTNRTSGACLPFLQVDSGQANARAIDAKSAERVSVMDFCKISDVGGVADSTACIQTAVNNLCAAKGGELYFPPNTYLINGTVLLPCSGLALIGQSIGNPYDLRGAHILAGHRTDTAQVFKALVTSATSAVGEANAPSSQGGTQRFSYGPNFRFLTMENKLGSVTNGRPGAFIELNYTTNSTLDHVEMYAACVGLRINGGFGVGTVDSRIESFEPNCNPIELRGDVTKSFTTLDVATFTRTYVTASTSGSCYDIQDRVQTVWWDSTVCETGGRALHYSCPTMTALLYCGGFFKLNDFEAESFNTPLDLIEITDMADGLEMNISWLRGYYSGAAANNLISIVPSRFAAAQQGLPISMMGSWLKHAGGSCIYLQSENVTLIGNHVMGCGRLGGGPAYAALEIRANGVVATGNIFCGADYLVDTVPTPTGVLITNGADYLNITGNLFAPGAKGCTTAVTGTATHGNISANVGP